MVKRGACELTGFVLCIGSFLDAFEIFCQYHLDVGPDGALLTHDVSLEDHPR